ncbi:MAG: sigma-70 family RNA polymerase sigma factor [Verrucomicrobia subdivision 3 bacterium]|nr:sigma-70 family RNA polymerase sigma factor [Limisphaerales bacterium]
MEDSELIECYARTQSESAFKALVERHAGLVYGSALRQVCDSQLAEDVTQAVFILLARKAASLRRGTVVSGWLFQTTRFVARRAIRTEQRRQRREQEAFEMQQLNSPDEAWRRMEPVIDDALNQLGHKDRDALLLRYVEGRAMREVGDALGVTEEAAKKRVTRAVEKVRNILAARGVSLSSALLAGALGFANASVPATVLASIATAATATASMPSAAALAADVIAAWRWSNVKIAAGIAASAAIAVVLISMLIDPRTDRKPAPAPIALPPIAAGDVPTPPAAPVRQPEPQPNALRFRAVAADTREGIAGAKLSVNFVVGGNWEQRYDLVTDSNGWCIVPYPPETGRLDVGVFRDGWAARFVTWPAEGQPGIAAEYTLRLDRVTNAVGGWVRDPRGRPVANAEIWFGASGTGDSAHRERPRERFGLTHSPPVTQTDAQGRWSIGFIPARHPGFSLRARHPNFAETHIISSDAQESVSSITREDLKKVWAGELVTIMKSAFTLRGTVVDERGRPIVGAKVQEREQSKIFKTDETGAFSVPGLPEGAWSFTVSAKGFAPVRTNTQISAAQEPIIVMLRPGAILRVRLLDEYGLEVPEATVGLEQWGEYRHVLEWRGKTGWDGRLEWRSAPPDVELELYARKDGFCYTRNVKVKADGDEHLIHLRHSLDVYGRVVDEKGYGIPDFRALPAYGGPERYSSDTVLRWFGGETVRGSNGLFKMAFVENELPWQLRIIADGYEDWTSDPLPTNQASVTLDITLKRCAPEDSVRGTVLDPDGRPVSGAQVALLSLEHNVRLSPKLRFEGNNRWLVISDDKGEFRFPVKRSAHSVAALDPGGYAHARVRDPRQPLQLQLQSWARIEGVVDSSAAAHPVETIELYDPAAQNYQGHVSLLGTYSVKVDANNRFVFENVPPGEFSVFINSLRGIPFHHRTLVTITPGETTAIKIVEQPGALLKGKFVPPAGQTIDWSKGSILAHVELEGLRSPPGWSSRSEGKLEAVDFWTSPAGREFASARRTVSLRINNDGSFISVERVPAGQHEFFGFFKNTSVRRKLTISAEEEELPHVDLGLIELR